MNVMSYHQRRTRRALSGAAPDVGQPMWYRAMNGMGGITSQPRPYRVARAALGSLGDDAPATNTLSEPTLSDPAWRAEVIGQLRAGVATMQKAELQKWLQIGATISIPVFAAIWKAIFRSGRGTSDPTVG